MRLFLLRHAEAGSAQTDSLRPLTNLGVRQVEQVARKFSPVVFSGIKTVEHSPLLRAGQTAELFRRHLALDAPLKKCGCIVPDYDCVEAAKIIAGSDCDRLLVGHNMLYSDLAGVLLGARTGGSGTCVDTAFGNACLLWLERLTSPNARLPLGAWRLCGFYRPDEEGF